MKVAKRQYKIMVKSSHLDSNILDRVLDNIKAKYEKTYNKADGYYVMEVMEILSYSQSISNANSLLQFNTTCKVKILSMKVGDWITGICAKAIVGIFIHASENVAKVFISNENILKSGIEYIEEDNTYRSNGKSVFEDGSKAMVRIFNMEFINDYRYLGDEIKQV